MTRAVLAALGTIGGSVLYASAWKAWRLRQRIQNTPTSRLRSASMGQVELKGLARPLGAPLFAPLSGRICVWFRWQVEEEVSTESNGKTQTHWNVVDQGVSVADFILDDSGALIQVSVAGATLDGPRVLNVTVSAWSGPRADLAGSRAQAWLGGLSRRRRFREWRLDVDRPLYALGRMDAVRETPGAPLQKRLVAVDPNQALFISSSSETQLVSRLGWSVFWRVVGGVFLIVVGLLALTIPITLLVL